MSDPRSASSTVRSWAVLVLTSLSIGVAATATTAQDDRRAGERFQTAIGLMQRELFEEAATQLERFVAERPRDARAAEAWYRLGVCRIETKDTAGAVDALTKSVASDFALRPEARYRLGLLQSELGKSPAAAATLRKLTGEIGTDHYLVAPAHYALGEALKAAGERDAAIAAFTAAADADRDASGPYAAPSLYAAGFLQRDAGRHADAARSFAAVVERFPQHAAAADCRLLAGDTSLAAGDRAAAITHYEGAIRAGGTTANDARYALGRALAETDPAAARQAFAAVVRAAHGTELAARANVESARLALQSGAHADAVQLLDAVLDGQTANVTPAALRSTALELRAIARLQSGAAPAAQKDLAELLAQPGAQPARVRCRFAEALVATGEHERAAAAYEQAIGEAADDAALLGEARYGLGLALHRLQRFDASTAAMQALTAQKPPHRLAVHATFAIAENLFALGKHRESVPLYARVPDGHELARKARFKAAWATYLHGERAAAAVAFEALIGDSAGNGATDTVAEEALAMAALARYETDDAAKALAHADRYLARHPKGPALARTERIAARVLTQHGDLQAAAARLARAAAGEPTADIAAGDRLQQADLQLKQGDVEGARKAYASLASRTDRTGAGAQFGLAWCAFELADDAACLRALDAVERHDHSAEFAPGALELRVVVHHRRGRFADAAAAAERFLAAHATHERAPEIRYALGLAKARAGDDAAARAALTPIAADPKHPRRDRAAYELGHACLRANDAKAADAAFRVVLTATQDEELTHEAHLQLGELRLAAGDGAAAKEYFAKVDGRHRQRAQYRLGFALRDAGDIAGALAAFDAAAAADGDLADEARFVAGELLSREGRAAEAVERLAELLRRSPNHPRASAARAVLAPCLVTTGAYAEAAATAETFLADARDVDATTRARVELARGRAHAALGARAPAEAALRKVTDLSEGELAAEAQFRLGELRAAANDVDGAIEALLQLSVLYTDPKWVPAGLELAIACYDKKNEPQKAAKLRDELRTRFPNHGKPTPGSGGPRNRSERR